MPSLVIYIAAGMLFVGTMPLPYGYYTLLRLVVCIVFTWAAFIAIEKQRKALPWLFGFVALLFNPIIKIHLDKEIWMVLDIAAGATLLASAKTIRADA